MGYTGYMPAEQAIREAEGLPYATGADDPPAWHDQPYATEPEVTAFLHVLAARRHRGDQPGAQPETRPAA